MTIKANGIFVPSFAGGAACGTIILQFTNEEQATEALVSLGDGWNIGVYHKQWLVRVFTTETLEVQKAVFKGWELNISPCGWKHCRDKCKSAEIDNVAHSVDRGASFTLEVPYPFPCKEQESLF